MLKKIISFCEQKVKKVYITLLNIFKDYAKICMDKKRKRGLA